MQVATNFHERKKKSQAKGKEVDLVKQSKAINENPQQLSAIVANIQMCDISSDEEEESDNNGTEFARESDSSDSDFY